MGGVCPPFVETCPKCKKPIGVLDATLVSSSLERYHVMCSVVYDTQPDSPDTEIVQQKDGGDWVKAPCKGCEVMIEDEGPYVADDWWCSQCWPYEKRKRLEAEIAALRAQLADAVKVVDAARDVANHCQWAWNSGDGYALGKQLLKAFEDYDAKHKEPAK